MHISRWTRIVTVVCLVGALAACQSAAEMKAKYLEKGRSLFAGGDYTKAQLELKNALKIDPADIDAQFLLAEIQEKQQNWREAVAAYQHIVEKDPKRIDAQIHLARIYLMANLPDKASQLADGIIKIDPKNADGYVLRAAAYSKRDDKDNAVKEVNIALGLDGGNVDALLLSAALDVRLNKPGDAANLLQGGLKIHSDSVPLHLALADVYDKQKNSEGAIAQLRELVRLAPDDLSNRTRLARYYSSQGKLQDAEQVLRQAVADHPGSDPAKLELVSFLDAKRGHSGAEAELLAMIDKNPQDETLRLGLAQLYQAAADPDKSEAVYREVIKREGTKLSGLDARNKLAVILAKRGKMQDALALLAEVLKESPSDNEALLLRGSIELAKKDAINAIADFRAVLKDQPNSAKVMQLLASAHLINGDTDLARDQLQQAVALAPNDRALRLQFAQVLAAKNESLDQAIEQLHTILKSSPSDRDALAALFNIQMAKRDWAGAQASAKLVKSGSPDMAVGMYMLGMAYQASGEHQAAIEEFQQGVDKSPQTIEPLTALTKEFLNQKRYADALKWLDRVIKQVPDDAVAYNLKGEVLLSQNQAEQAIPVFGKAIELQPKWEIPYANLAHAYAAGGESDKAIDAYQQGIKATGSAVLLMMDLAGLYEQKGNHDAAINQYKAVLDKNPSSAEAANNLAMMLASYKDDKSSLDKAKDLVKSLENSDNPAYLDTVGWVSYKNGDYDAAIAALEHAVKAVPNAKLVLYHLGMAQFAKGDKGSARRNLQQALEGKPSFYGLAEARATLDKLAKM